MIANKMYTNSPLLSMQFFVKGAPDYKSLPVSKKRQRKIDHLRRLLKSGVSRGEVWSRAIHQYNMAGNDIVEAMENA